MARSFDRKKSVFKTQPRILVLCEDSKSCKTYLEDAAIHFRAQADVEIAHCGNTDPLGIAEKAIQRKKKYDHVYCAIDRDSHENFDAAVNLVANHTNHVTLITSYPCYEFWLYLHFKLSRKTHVAKGDLSAGDCMVRELRKFNEMATYSKGGMKDIFELLLARLPAARKNADLVMREANSDQNLNPSTRLHELISIFENLGSPTPATT